MANEIAVAGTTGQTLYALVRNASGQIYNTSTSLFETYAAGSYASYAVTLAEQGATGYYLGSVPAGVTVQGRYPVQAKQQAGASAAATDPSVSSGVLAWSGTAEVDVLTNNDKTGYTASTVQDKTGYSLNLAQAVPTSNTAQTVGDALNAARAGSFGKWVIAGTTLTLYAPDGTTAVRSFALDNATSPTSRT